jgi:hypothetical protein
MTRCARTGRRAGNLPAELTSFVGRGHKTAHAVRLVRARGRSRWPGSPG